MLQRSVRSQLARVVGQLTHRDASNFARKLAIGERTQHPSTVNFPGPTKALRRRMAATLESLPGEKHWLSGGKRSAAIAANVLNNNEIIAVPTDTIYGFAGLAQSNEAVHKIYTIKARDRAKPLAITLCSVKEIGDWAEIDHLPARLLADLLPGPVTVVLKRTGRLNRALNPGHESVGIRVPRSNFLREVCKIVGEPLALTSANLSDEPSTLHPDEFSSLWPTLGAIFYDTPKMEIPLDARRCGSTVVDLTVPGKFRIIREGSRYGKDLLTLQHHLVQLELENYEHYEDVKDKIAARESR